MDESAPRHFRLDARAVRRAFDRASAAYDSAAVLQTDVRNRLLGRLEYVALEPKLLVDVGAGTAHASRELKRRYPGARVIALDIAPGMLREARRQQGWIRRFDRLCADALQLPFADASVDLLFSNLILSARTRSRSCAPPGPRSTRARTCISSSTCTTSATR
jgi:malonyl-CoA O-methyltransferase